MPTGSLAHRRLSIAALAILAGLGLDLGTGAAPAAAASFDCEKPGLAADERAICANRDLNDLDVKMATTFELIAGLLPMGNRGAVQDQQVEWLAGRRARGADLTCLRAAYGERLEQLRQVYGEIERPM